MKMLTLLMVVLNCGYALTQPPAPIADIAGEFEKVKLKATELVKAGRWHEAIEIYEDFINSHKGASKWVYEAVACMGKVIKRFGVDEREWAMKRIEHLKDMIHETLVGTLYHGLACAEVGDVLFEMGCYEDARGMYEKGIEYRGDDWFVAWIGNKVARSYLMEGRMQEAVRMYEGVIGEHEGQVREVFRARVGLWQVSVMRGKVEDASKVLRVAYEGLIEVEPDAIDWACELMAVAIFEVWMREGKPLKWRCAACGSIIGYGAWKL